MISWLSSLKRTSRITQSLGRLLLCLSKRRNPLKEFSLSLWRLKQTNAQKLSCTSTSFRGEKILKTADSFRNEEPLHKSIRESISFLMKKLRLRKTQESSKRHKSYFMLEKTSNIEKRNICIWWEQAKRKKIKSLRTFCSLINNKLSKGIKTSKGSDKSCWRMLTSCLRRIKVWSTWLKR